MTPLNERTWPLLARLLRDHLRTIADPTGALVAGNLERLHAVLGPHLEPGAGERVTAELAFLWARGALYVVDDLLHVQKGAGGAKKRSAAAERKARQRERERERERERGRERQRQLELDQGPPESVTSGVTPPVTTERDIEGVTGVTLPPAPSPSSPLTLPPSPSLPPSLVDADERARGHELAPEESATTGVTVTRDSERDGKIRCPADLKLTADQFGTLSMTIGLDQESADALAAKFVAKARVNETDLRSREVWLKCLSSAICSDWSNGRRPGRGTVPARHRQPDSGYNPFQAAQRVEEDVERPKQARSE